MGRRHVVVALLVALVASAGTFAYLAIAGESEEVVVMVCDVPSRGLISAQSVRLEKIPARAVHAAACRRIEEVAGKYAIQAMTAGEQVLANHVAAGEHGGIVAALASDLRAMFVPLDEARAVGGLVKAGGRVDVIFVASEQKMAPIARCVLRSVLVLSSGYQGAPGSPGQREVERERGVVVAVTPADAERLAFCLENGRVYVTAVPFGAAMVPSRGATWGDVFDQGPGGAP